MATVLYPGIAFSPQATLTNNLGAADTIIEVSDASAFPPAPNLATIGTDEEGETILYTAKTETALSGCKRGVEGAARAWTAGELIGRNFTAKDHADLIAAISETRGAATAAAGAATEAGEAAKAAQDAARAAQEAASEAEGKATEAAETAEKAAQDAGQAKKDAQTAADAAATAQGAAETAQTAATSASTEASNAKKEAGEAKKTADEALETAQAAGGLYPQIIVTVAAGAVVTCSNGSKSYEQTSTGAAVVFNVPDYGTWSVSAERDGLPSNTVEIVVDTAKQYAAALAFFESTITVNVEAGSSVVCEGGGKTQTKTSETGSVVFTVTSAATYTITATTGDETTSGTVQITASGEAKTLALEYFRSTITVNIAAGAFVTCTDGKTSLEGTSNGSVVFMVHNAGTWQITGSMNGETTSGTVQITAGGQSKVLNLEFFSATITVNVESGSTVTCAKGSNTQTKTSTGSVVFTVKEAGTYTITATKSGQEASGTVQITANGQTKTLSLAYVHIYSAAWDGSSTTKLTRGDDAALFTDPVPAVGNGAGSSPFDNRLPWSGMTKVTDGNNVLVKIPKYWVKVSHAPFKVQIADKATPGYQVSPAHRDRGDGVGERDVVYIGRYECDGSYMSRSGIHALGAEYWQADIALHLTWWFLYIVEYADWNGQTAIGQGNVSSGAKINTGATDSMTYHTGRAAGTDGQTAVQYRNIENPWGNVREWRDGIIFSDTNICTYNNPANFSDAYNGTGAVVRSNKRAASSGWIKAWGHDTNDPSFIYPSEIGGSETTFVPDYCYYNAGVRALSVGGNYGGGSSAGPFCLYGSHTPASTNANLGSRLQKLPRAA
nr:hypothetical protein [uncultured Oscillibacter sp.]